MKWVAFIAVLFGLVAVALMLANQTGATQWAVVNISWGEGSYTTNFAVVLIGLIAVLVVLRLLGALFGLPTHLLQSWRERRLAGRRKAFIQGVSLYLQGEREQARRQLLRAAQVDSQADAKAHLGGEPFAPIAGLLAAHCAVRDGRFDETRAALQAVRAAGEHDDFAASLIEAEMQIESGQVGHAGQAGQAAELLEELRRRKPDSYKVAELAARAGEITGDWDVLAESLPTLRRLYANRPDRLRAVVTPATRRWLQRAAEQLGKDALRRRWRELEEAAKPALLADYARMLARADGFKEAEQLLREAVESRWNEGCIVAYGDLEGDVDARLKHAERWLAGKPKNPAVLLCLGKLYRKAKVWDKAQDCLKTSFSLSPSVEACRELAAVAEHAKESNRGGDHAPGPLHSS